MPGKLYLLKLRLIFLKVINRENLGLNING